MPLTPQQLAELQRLKQSYAPVIEAQRRKQQAQANLEKMHGLPPVKPKAKGGTIPSQTVMRLAIGGQGPKNWLKESVEQVVDPMLAKEIVGNREYPHGPELDEATRNRIAELQQTASQPGYVGGAPKVIAHLEEKLKAPDVNKAAMNQWIQRNLTNYIRKQMATHDDPIRKLAEQGIVHISSEQVGLNRYKANAHRATHGADRLGESEEAQAWEDAADVAMEPMYIRNLHPDYREPWMEKADPKTQIFTPTNQMHAHYLGFDHIVDILKQDLAEGRIRPDQLSKVSIEQAVRRVHQYDQERKKAQAETALKATEGMPVHKDYGNGYKWIELTMPQELPQGWTKKTGALGETLHYDPEGQNSVNPNQEKLEQALKYEGDTMGHCVGGYTPDVASGKSRIFTLRDEKNEPHVTVEVKPKASAPRHDDVLAEMKKNYNLDLLPDDHYDVAYEETLNNLKRNPPLVIKQIKGKGNAKPKKDYIPFVQDFVRSGNWSEIGDINNAEMRDVHPESDLAKAMQQKGLQAPRYVTNDEMSDLLKEHNVGLYSWKKARGGRVTHAHHLAIEERAL